MLHRGRQPDAAPLNCRSQRRWDATPNGRSTGQPIVASCTTAVRPTRTASRGIPRARSSRWNGEKWVGDVPDYKVDSPPDAGMGPFIMLPEGVARLFVPGQFVEGPFTEHYEPLESPVAESAASGAELQPRGEAVQDAVGRAGQGRGFPDRLHHLPAHRALPLLDEEQRLQHGDAAGVLRGDLGRTGQGKGHRQRADGAGYIGPRLHRRQGDGDASASSR